METDPFLTLSKSCSPRRSAKDPRRETRSSYLNEHPDKRVFDNSHISYAPDDSGVAIGAALLAHNKYSKKIRKAEEITQNYFGPDFSDFEIKKILENSKVKYYKPKNLHHAVANGIADGKFVGWFNGKMEFGPRALGNRSILADPRKKINKQKLNYAVKIEPSLGLDPLCIKNLLFLILNNDTGWTNVTEKQFQLTSVEESDYVYIFASPEKTDELCAPIETNSIYSCRKDQDIVLNFFRWQNGAVDFKNDMETYRIYLINHETGHILGWGHVGCPKEGAIAPVMMQQSKGTEGCIPYGWPAYETIKSKFNR